MDYKVRSVCLSQIDVTDQTFRITTTIDAADLVSSIQRIGLLQPPLIVPKGQTYIVVCGFRRIAACRSLSITSMPARIDDHHRPGLRHAQMAIADNACQRPLNVVEQSRALALIRRFTNDSTDWPAIAASVGLPSSRAAMDRLLPIAHMPESLQMAIVEGRIALPVATSINSLHPDDAKVMGDVLRSLNTGLNNQRELLELIVELAIIEGTSVSRVLAGQDIAPILAEDDSPLPQRVQRLRQALKKKRYPELSKAEDAFHRAVKALKVDSAIGLQPPRFFEGKTFRLTLSVNSRRQLKSLLPDLEKIANHPHILPD